MPDLETLTETLDKVMDPELHRSIVNLGMVHDLAFHDGTARFTLALTTMACPMRQSMQDDARKRLLALDGVKRVEIACREMTDAEKKATFGEHKESDAGTAAAYNHIINAIAVMSGKGGVGKSTTAALLAVALRRKGFRVGILDADITGPSIPKMLVRGDERPMGSPLGILPVTSESGILLMSINLLLADPNQAVIWRGPLISGAIKQFYGDVVWGELDYLIVDLPPGTSDASLTVMQSIPLNGIVLVTTPQSLAGMVVRKASSMAAQLNIPIVGVIENMAYVTCPHCGEQIELFGPSHSAELALSLQAPLLGRLPIRPDLAELGDDGRMEEADLREFEAIVERMLAVLPEEASRPPMAHG